MGVSIKEHGKPARYYAWGHPTGNNCTVAKGVDALRKAVKNKHGVVCHNGKFDGDVAETHLGVTWPWDKTHDTMILAYLIDPHSKVIDLKPLSERYLDMPPSERDAVRDWLIANKIVTKVMKNWGAYISKAPGDLVGEYANGDTIRTEQLFQLFYPRVVEVDMIDAYRREIRLLPVLLRAEREGVAVDAKKLRADVTTYTAAITQVDEMIGKLLRMKNLNVDSDTDLADAIERRFPGRDWVLTPTGQRSTSKENLKAVITNKPLLAMLTYRASVMTCLNTFMQPWLLTASDADACGRIYTYWNSTAQDKGGGSRTGRLSSTPNFQNIPTLKSPKFVDAIEYHARYLSDKGLPALPQVRSYIVADTKQDVLCDRDFSQQELRVLAHFEDGAMMRGYLENPRLDLHDYARQVIKDNVGLELTRKDTKNIAFGLLYGMGLGSLAEKLGLTVDEARTTRNAYLNTFPGIKLISSDLKMRAQNDLPMRTWGGRLYYVEPPKIIDGKLRSFEYKLFNYLIQGSSADITKEAILAYDELRRDGHLRLTVHDELLISVPKKAWRGEMELLRRAMENVPLDVPLLSDGGVGYRWTELKEVK